MPKVSIVVAVYNVEKYVSKCIESILKQTFTDFELLLVNDGSKDSSLSILKEYALKDLRIEIIDKRNGGLSESVEFLRVNPCTFQKLRPSPEHNKTRENDL